MNDAMPEGPPKRLVARIALHLFRIALAVAIFVAMFRIFSVERLDQLFHVKAGYLALAAVSSILGNVVGSFRWKYALDSVVPSNPSTLKDMFFVTCGANLINTGLGGASLMGAKFVRYLFELVGLIRRRLGY